MQRIVLKEPPTQTDNMSLKCSWFKCDLILVKHLDGEGHYVLCRCKRCLKEQIHFIREDVVQEHSKDAMKIVRKCMSDPYFVNCCIRYRKYRDILKMERGMLYEVALNSFYQEYQLELGERVPDPILLFSLKRWHIYDKSEKKKDIKRNCSTSRNKQEENPLPDQPPPLPPMVQEEPRNKKRPRPSIKRLQEMSYDELDRFLWNCVEKEEYEKAAAIKKEMDRRTGLAN